jgi:hypothetical protein
MVVKFPVFVQEPNRLLSLLGAKGRFSTVKNLAATSDNIVRQIFWEGSCLRR